MKRPVSRATAIIALPLAAGLMSTYLHTYKNQPLSESRQQPSQIIAPPTATNAQCHLNGQLPDPVCTPGVANANVTQENIQQTICVQGYTKTIRPPASYTNQLKQQQMMSYGFQDSPRMHEEDHLISLELGGSPTDPKNLWPEPGASPNPKDKIENTLHAAICSGKISLQDAQTRISKDWTTAEQGL
ncbi:MAG: hypothetical protein NVSMB46_01720 [Candidatus Saccharimonadales bacterium]